MLDDDVSAELFVASNVGSKPSVMIYRRFSTVSDAVKHAVEVIGLKKFPGTVIEYEDGRLNSSQIAERYAATTQLAALNRPS